MTKISLVRTTDRAEGVRRTVTLLQSNPVGGTAVTLKLNFNSADAAPDSTHNDTLNALVLTLQKMGATRVTLAERSGPGDSTHQVMEKKGIFGLTQNRKNPGSARGKFSIAGIMLTPLPSYIASHN